MTYQTSRILLYSKWDQSPPVLVTTAFHSLIKFVNIVSTIQKSHWASIISGSVLLKSFCRSLCFHYYPLVFFDRATGHQHTVSYSCAPNDCTSTTLSATYSVFRFLLRPWINPARKCTLELKKINPALEYVLHGYAATLITVNEDDLNDSDRLSSRSVLTHCTAL